MPIRIGRHEESMANIGHPNWKGKAGPDVPLSHRGLARAHGIGAYVAREFPGLLERAVLFESPALRVTQTMDGIISGAESVIGDGGNLPMRRNVDKHLGEVDFGGEDWSPEKLLQSGGIWNHRFKSGQSFVANGYLNIKSFIDGLENRIVAGQEDFFIVTHGWTVLTFVVAWFNLGGFQFDAMENIGNGEFIIIARPDELKEQPIFRTAVAKTGRWGVTGIRFRKTKR